MCAPAATFNDFDNSKTENEVCLAMGAAVALKSGGLSAPVASQKTCDVAIQGCDRAAPIFCVITTALPRLNV